MAKGQATHLAKQNELRLWYWTQMRPKQHEMAAMRAKITNNAQQVITLAAHARADLVEHLHTRRLQVATELCSQARVARDEV